MCAGKCVLVLTVILSLSFSGALAQKTKAQLQKEKQQNLAKIKEVEGILTETAAKKKNSLGELNALNQRIHQQEILINSIKGEIGLLDNEIGENKDIIDALESDLKKLRKEYSDMLFAAQKTHNSITPLSFLFSAKSLDDLLTRLRYIEQYSEARKVQAEQIVKVQEELSGQVKEIESKRTVKNELLNEQLAENNNLSSLKKKQNTLVRSLEKEEKQLKRDLEDTKKTLALLDKKIEEIIREELAREKNTARSRESIALSSSFEENKARFPWPVSGFVSQKFGRQNHPVLKGVVLQSEGVNIQTKEDEKVKSIFEGEVKAVAVMPTIGNSVIISHGEYFTVYSGLREVFVKTGQKVNTNQEIGEVLTNSEGVSELRFRIYKNRTPLDPQLWLGRL
ncbi:MAG TPA: peptidoglycan DD-metalloendopeptidase family protein [Cyclobacteriaceae bacterium]|nr:peptidoglycan DD-metalloendopeptidase family protein [Cyclobacteriaceae bacterium]